MLFMKKEKKEKKKHLEEALSSPIKKKMKRILKRNSGKALEKKWIKSMMISIRKKKN